MAITDSYASPAEYRSAIGKDYTEDDLDVEWDLAAVSRYIERKLGRFFTRDIADVTRTFSGNGARALPIDDLVSITSIKSDDDYDGVAETTWAATDYQLWPSNAALGPEPEPYTRIDLPTWSSRTLSPGQLITITGIWGWPLVPMPIKRACIQLTAILRMEGSRASRTLSGDGEILEPNPLAQNIVREIMSHGLTKVLI